MKKLFLGLTLLASMSSFNLQAKTIECGKVNFAYQGIYSNGVGSDLIAEKLDNEGIDYNFYNPDYVFQKNDIIIEASYSCSSKTVRPLAFPIYETTDSQWLVMDLYKSEGNKVRIFEKSYSDSDYGSSCDGVSSSKDRKWARLLIKKLKSICSNY